MYLIIFCMLSFFWERTFIMKFCWFCSFIDIFNDCTRKKSVSQFRMFVGIHFTVAWFCFSGEFGSGDRVGIFRHAAPTSGTAAFAGYLDEHVESFCRTPTGPGPPCRFDYKSEIEIAYWFDLRREIIRDSCRFLERFGNSMSRMRKTSMYSYGYPSDQ